MVDKTPWVTLTAAMLAYVTGGFTKPDYSCMCIALSHDHLWGSQCPRRGRYAGGPCNKCRYWDTFPDHRDNLS